jgi:hypothetical protein
MASQRISEVGIIREECTIRSHSALEGHDVIEIDSEDLVLTGNATERPPTRLVRAAIESGALHGTALLRLLLSVPFRNRDVWVDEVLGFEPPPPDIPDLPRESVPYLPCGVDEILAMLREVSVGSEHELVDLGSGLGRVVILSRLIAGARAHGIEIQEPLVRRARARAVALGADVSFTHANVADVELDGSIFFLYAPCNGEMLTAVLARLKEVAERRPIVVCAVGLEFQGVSWLVPRKIECVSLAVYDSSFTQSA